MKRVIVFSAWAGVLFLVLQGGAQGAAAAIMHNASLGWQGRAQAEPRIIYDSATNAIEVTTPGAVVDLTTISNALRDNSLLERLGSSEWLLKVNLRIFEEVTLELHGTAAGGDVNWLKLRSEPSGFAAIESSNGNTSIRNTRITSWDTRSGAFDTQFLDGSNRAYVSAKNRSAAYLNRMDVVDSEVSYLGFFEETAYGISWKVISEPGRGETGILGRGMTGTITGSKFHHNYFGTYFWGVGGAQVRDNEFYSNYGYGFDAHTGTARTVFEDNFSHDNGLHGIIFADRCTGNYIRRNRSVNNKGHGIMLHELSDANVVEDNTVTGNDDGIPLFESSNNIIARNRVSDNVTGIRVYGRASASSLNRFEENIISGSKGNGVYLYDAASKNTFLGNQVFSSRDAGFYLASVSDNLLSTNVIRSNEFGIRIDQPSPGVPSRGNQFVGNAVSDNRQYGFLSYAPPDVNVVADNEFAGNGSGDVRYSGQNGAPPAGSPAVRTIGLIMLAAIIVVATVSALLSYHRSRTRSGR